MRQICQNCMRVYDATFVVGFPLFDTWTRERCGRCEGGIPPSDILDDALPFITSIQWGEMLPYGPYHFVQNDEKLLRYQDTDLGAKGLRLYQILSEMGVSLDFGILVMLGHVKPLFQNKVYTKGNWPQKW